MTKIEIIESLLEKRAITAKEALILMQTEKEYVYYPHYPYYHFNGPVGVWSQNPVPIPCTTSDETTFTYTSN